MADTISENMEQSCNIDKVLPRQVPPNFEFHEISFIDIASAIARLSSSSAPGHDGITANMLKSTLLLVLHYADPVEIN